MYYTNRDRSQWQIKSSAGSFPKSTYLTTMYSQCKMPLPNLFLPTLLGSIGFTKNYFYFFNYSTSHELYITWDYQICTSQMLKAKDWYRVFKSKWYKFWGLFTMKWVCTFIMKYILVTSIHRQIILTHAKYPRHLLYFSN